MRSRVYSSLMKSLPRIRHVPPPPPPPLTSNVCERLNKLIAFTKFNSLCNFKLANTRSVILNRVKLKSFTPYCLAEKVIGACIIYTLLSTHGLQCFALFDISGKISSTSLHRCDVSRGEIDFNIL